MDYHLYFHKDFDGVASAAVMLNFLKSRGDDIISFTPIDYSPELKSKWANFKFRQPFIIVDFLYHPKAGWWFDHHPTTFIENAWRKKFKNDKNHAFSSIKKSACDLMASHLKKEFGYRPPKYIANLIKWATIIDSFSYKSAKEAIEGKQPAVKLAKVIDVTDFKGGAGRVKHFGAIIKSLAGGPIAKTIQIPFVRKENKRVEKKKKETKKIFRKTSTINGNTLFIDNVQAKAQFPHCLGYYFYPKIDYALTLEFYGNYYHLVVGKNPWKKTPVKVHIGKLLNKYGGGGHKGVGGMERKKKSEILRIAGEVIKYLNRYG